jgi:hypothetical protein
MKQGGDPVHPVVQLRHTPFCLINEFRPIYVLQSISQKPSIDHLTVLT